MQKLYLYHQRHCWNQTDTCVRFVTKGFKEIRICRCIGDDIKYHGSCWKESRLMSKRGFSCARNRVACTMIHVMLLGTLWGSKNTFEGNIAMINNGFVKSAQRVMLFNLIIKLILKLVALEAILVIVAEFFQGTNTSHCLFKIDYTSNFYYLCHSKIIETDYLI